MLETLWSKIYLPLRLAIISITLHSFQYKVLNNILFLYKNLQSFGITNTALCSYCNTFEETPILIFFDFIHVKCLWQRLQTKCKDNFKILNHKQSFLDNIMKQLTVTIFWVMFYWFLNIFYIPRENRILNIDIY